MNCRIRRRHKHTRRDIPDNKDGAELSPQGLAKEVLVAALTECPPEQVAERLGLTVDEFEDITGTPEFDDEYVKTFRIFNRELVRYTAWQTLIDGMTPGLAMKFLEEEGVFDELRERKRRWRYLSSYGD